MNRWLGVAVAFSIGVGGSFAAVSASGSTPVVRDGDLLGQPTFRTYCQWSHDDDRAVPILRGSDAFGWACATRANGLFVTYSIDVGRACAFEFGDPSFARSWDQSWPYSWECFYGDPP